MVCLLFSSLAHLWTLDHTAAVFSKINPALDDVTFRMSGIYMHLLGLLTNLTLIHRSIMPEHHGEVYRYIHPTNGNLLISRDSHIPLDTFVIVSLKLAPHRCNFAGACCFWLCQKRRPAHQSLNEKHTIITHIRTNTLCLGQNHQHGSIYTYHTQEAMYTKKIIFLFSLALYYK